MAEHDISRFYGKIACGQLQGPDTKRGERLERQRLVFMGHTFLVTWARVVQVSASSGKAVVAGLDLKPGVKH